MILKKIFYMQKVTTMYKLFRELQYLVRPGLSSEKRKCECECENEF